MTRSAPLCVLILNMVWLAAWAVPAAAAPKAHLWSRWEAHDPSSDVTIDHSAWNTFLKAYVSPGPNGVNLVSYSEVSFASRQILDDYVKYLSGVKVSGLNRPEQMAYWINLYNALTVKVVLDHYPIKSIRDINISPGFFTSGPWDKKLLRIEGEKVSLNDIEHRILRPIWRDPRIHYAVNCASMGCPNLRPQAFTPENLEDMLDAGAKDYVNNPRGAEVSAGGKLTVSSIYEWYKEDFGGTDRGVIEHLKKYAKPGLRKRLKGISRISDDRYDWSLNEPRNR
jgi:hypothetical protein